MENNVNESTKTAKADPKQISSIVTSQVSREFEGGMDGAGIIASSKTDHKHIREEKQSIDRGRKVKNRSLQKHTEWTGAELTPYHTQNVKNARNFNKSLNTKN